MKNFVQIFPYENVFKFVLKDYSKIILTQPDLLTRVLKPPFTFAVAFPLLRFLI